MTEPTAEPDVDLAAPSLLGVVRVSKSYGGVAVLDDVSVEFRAGEVHALLGENGAGKSTLVKIVAGVITADRGDVVGAAHDKGDVAMVFQELSVVPEMSVLDNLALAVRGRGLRVHDQRLQGRARSALEAAGLGSMSLASPVATLSLAQRQLLEIARGLMAEAMVLILDEPTATLSDAEIDRVHAVIRQLAADGRAIIYITHRLGEVFMLSDRITIMRSGRVVASSSTDALTMRRVVAHMLGTDHVPVDKSVNRPAIAHGGLSVTGLSSRGRFRDVSFTAVPGSILALFGQIGSGADDIVKALAGLTETDGGGATLQDLPLALRSRAQTQRDGVAYVSADRVMEGVFLDASVATNMSSGALERICEHGIIRASKERTLAQDLARTVALDPTRVRENVSAFSGGNQQKVAVARALATRPRVLLLNEPTRGVDIGARSEIYRSVRDLLDGDVVVVVYSSDIVEIRELADRVITLYRGAVVGEHDVDGTDDATLITEILNGGHR